MRDIAFAIEGQYDDEKICVSSVVQYYKNFTGSWQWRGNDKIPKRVTRTLLKPGTFDSL